MPTFRKERMGEAIRKVITEKLIRDHSPIPNALVTINHVHVTDDYGWAKIFFSVFGGEMDEEKAKKAMKEHQAEYRYEISQKLNMRKTPKVEFCFDKNTEYASKINELLKS